MDPVEDLLALNLARRLALDARSLRAYISADHNREGRFAAGRLHTRSSRSADMQLAARSRISHAAFRLIATANNKLYAACCSKESEAPTLAA